MYAKVMKEADTSKSVRPVKRDDVKRKEILTGLMPSGDLLKRVKDGSRTHDLRNHNPSL